MAIGYVPPAAEVDTSALVAKADYNANTVLAANTDDTPAALTVAEQTLVGRITGGSIDDLSAAQVLTLLGIPTIADIVLRTLVDAKGDLLVATAADTLARLAKGTDGHVLTADSAQSTGLKWATAAGLAVQRFKSPLYYIAPFGTSAISTAQVSQDTAYAHPLPIYETSSFDEINIEVTTLVASTSVRLALYDDTGDGYPGARLADFGTVDSTTTGFKPISISQTLSPGLYWLVCIGVGGAPTLRTASASGVNVVPGKTAVATTGLNRFYQGAAASGVAPNPFPTSVTNAGNGPFMFWLRAS